jgi:ParB family chromosome partitioning protein
MAQAESTEGSRWIEVAPDFAYGHTFGLSQLRGETVLLTVEAEATRDAFQAEFDRLASDIRLPVLQDRARSPNSVSENPRPGFLL